MFCKIYWPLVLLGCIGCDAEALSAITLPSRWTYRVDDGPTTPIACDATVDDLPQGLRVDPEGVDMLGRAYREAYIKDQGVPLTGVTCDPSVPQLARGEVRVRDGSGVLLILLTLECDPSVACDGGTI